MRETRGGLGRRFISSLFSQLPAHFLLCDRDDAKKKKMRRTFRLLRVLLCWCCCLALYAPLLSPLLLFACAAGTTTTTTTATATNDVDNDPSTASSHTNKNTSNQGHDHNGTSNNTNDSVIILSAVDGTLAGISRSSGRLLWKQQQQQQQQSKNNHEDASSSYPIEWNKFLAPLVSTTTTTATTTTTTKSIHHIDRRNNFQWRAIPSIDGTVYLTSGNVVPDSSSSSSTTNSNNDSNNDGDTQQEQQQQQQQHQLSISTIHHIRDIVNRAPFVDAQNQQFVIGSRSVMVAAIDERSGEILRVIPKFRKDDGSTDDDTDDTDTDELPSSLEGRDVVWIGRLEYTVTIHDLQHGNVDIEFSIAEILSVDEMLHGYSNSRNNDDGGGGGGSSSISTTAAATTRVIQDDKKEKENERILTDYITDELRHPKFGNRILRLPAPTLDDDNDKNHIKNNNNDGEGDHDDDDDDDNTKSIIQSQGSPFLVSTPSGNVAFRDTCRLSNDDKSQCNLMGWVTFALLDSPIVYAIEASTGRKIRVNMLDDSSIVSSSSSLSSDDESNNDDDNSNHNNKNNGLSQLLEKQIASIIKESSCTIPGECAVAATTAFSPHGSIVGSLHNGQMYALPLGERSSSILASRRSPSSSSSSQDEADDNNQLSSLFFPSLPLMGLPQPHQYTTMASEMANTNNNRYDVMSSAVKLNTNLAATTTNIGFHHNRHDSYIKNVAPDKSDGGKGVVSKMRHDSIKHGCTPSSPLYPGCLIGASLIMRNLLDDDGNVDMAAVFESSDLDYDLYLDMLEAGNNSNNNNNNNNTRTKTQFLKVMTSWIAPTVALIFVLSFEMGRRERLRRSNIISVPGNSVGAKTTADEAMMNDAHSNSKSHGGVIQLSDEILGFGGHGTIVYKGVLDKRQVAVKRLLNMYHASADREIELLIESDGHPNVVRYFLKEMRGDFVYLALELCDMSLNDLIVSLSKLRNVQKENFRPITSTTDVVMNVDDFESATKSLLLQIASGVRHIHSLRIVHRDLKPQNILLALRSKLKQPVLKPEDDEHGVTTDTDTEVDETTSQTTVCSDTNSILEAFKNQEYVPKISDMGLGKQLAGQSSFGLSTLGTNSVGGGLAGDAGGGAGSVGWQAPEVMAQRFLSHEALSSKNIAADISENSPEASPLDYGMNRTSRSVDIFSLGCIFYCTILPGSHPFGEWYEREANIMKNAPNREDLEFVSPDASDLILSMIHRNAKSRPTADEVCEHPFFWDLPNRLKFLCDVSDRIELVDLSDEKESKSLVYAVEKDAANIFGTSWEKKLDPGLLQASVTRRSYDPSSVRDLLRMIRNKHHHYDELPTELKSRIGSSTHGFSLYAMRTFPQLLMHCYRFCVDNLHTNDSLVVDYKLPIARSLSIKSIHNKLREKKSMMITALPTYDKLMEDDSSDDDVNNENKVDYDEQVEIPIIQSEESNSQHGIEIDIYPSASPEFSKEYVASDANLLDQPVDPPSRTAEELDISHVQSNAADLSGIIVWTGSNAAKDLNCRGWYRSDNEWLQQIDAKLLRKRDTSLERCAEDPKFRTRLCNHFDDSQGMHCPMRKKGKCIFAHGPVELRVKEGKYHRWGTLVNKHGLCANSRASGGEDTYGAARTIEKARKEQGQWTVDSKPQQKKPQQQGKAKPKVVGKPTTPSKKG